MQIEGRQIIELDRFDRRIFDTAAAHHDTMAAQHADIVVAHDGHHLMHMLDFVQRQAARVDRNAFDRHAHAARIEAAENRPQLDARHAGENDRRRMGVDNSADVGPGLVNLAVDHRLVGSLKHAPFVELLTGKVRCYDVPRFGKQQAALLTPPAANQHRRAARAARADMAGGLFE